MECIFNFGEKLNSNTSYKIVVTGVTYGKDNLPYDNEALSFFDGSLILEEGTSELLCEIGNAGQKINISQGGNLGGGFSFSFSTINNDFAKTMRSDAVFFINCRCQLILRNDDELGEFTDLELWTGNLESDFEESETKVFFKCTDMSRAERDSIGSDLIPICLNRNYNCKMVLKEFIDYRVMISQYSGGSYNHKFIYDIDTTKNIIILTSLYNVDYDKEYTLVVVSGSGSGEKIKILKFEEVTSISGMLYYLYVDSSTDNLKKYKDSDLKNVSIINIVEYKKELYLSQNHVESIHNYDDNLHKNLTIISDGREYELSGNSDYSLDLSTTNSIVKIESMYSEDEILRYSSYNLSPSLIDFNWQFLPEPLPFTTERLRVNFKIKFSQMDFSVIKTRLETEKDTYLINGKTTIKDVFLFPDATDSGFVGVKVNRKNMNTYGLYTYLSGLRVDAINITTLIDSINVYQNGLDLIVETSLSTYKDKDVFVVSDLLRDIEILKSLTTYFDIEIRTDAGFIDPIPDFNLPIVTSDIAIIENVKVYNGGLLKIDNLSIGCNGENVQSGNQFESVGDTIKYVQTDLIGVNSADIDYTSYQSADALYPYFLNDTSRNVAPQITTQTDSNSFLKDILYFTHLGLYVNSAGKYILKNWLPYSRVFNNGLAPYKVFTPANMIDISNITKDDLNDIVSDFELQYDYNDATETYQRFIRIKNTDLADFDFARDIEGVSPSNALIAEEIKSIGRAGYLRIKKLSQTKKESRSIKYYYSDNTLNGEAEALYFIRNQLLHVNRQHKYLKITIPFSAENLAIELLYFVSVRDPKITGNIEELGWVVERVIDTKRDQIILTILLDISVTDPFIVYIGVIQDTSEVDDIIENNSISTDIIQDGRGY